MNEFESLHKFWNQMILLFVRRLIRSNPNNKVTIIIKNLFLKIILKISSNDNSIEHTRVFYS